MSAHAPASVDAANPAAGILPYERDDRQKTQQVASMFDGIARRYDLLNKLISLGADRRWRRKALSSLAAAAPRSVLDVATGTGDLLIEMDRLFRPERIVGIDLSEEMLSVARRKTEGESIDAQLEFRRADVEQLPFPDASFEAVTVSFGVRNFEDLRAGLAEMVRVLRPGGRCVVLETSTPRAPLAAFANVLALRIFVPLVGRLLSRDPAAYRYLPKTVAAFPQGETFSALLLEAGCERVKATRLRPGVCTVYVGTK